MRVVFIKIVFFFIKFILYNLVHFIQYISIIYFYLFIFIHYIFNIKIMVKEFKEQNNNRQRPSSFQRGGRGGFNRNQPQGPPAYVIPYCVFQHPSQNQILLKVTDKTRVPKFNRSIYLQSKAKIGNVDQILGPIDNYYFSAKLQQGIKANSFKKGQILYMNPQDLLPLERFLPKPKVKGVKGSGGNAGGFQRGGQRGGFQRGGSRGGPRGGGQGFRGGRGAPRGGNFRGGSRGGR